MAEAVPGAPGLVRVVVTLESGAGMETVRDEVVPALRGDGAPADLAWTADQYAQETIGTTLAERGWEVIGGGELPESEPGALPRSAT